jgi:hypothetical protein
MNNTKLLRPFVLGVPFVIALSCTVADKGDYTFDDNPGGEGPAGGSSGSGGGKAGGGKGNGGSANGGSAGGGRAGMDGGGGDAESGGESGQGGSSAGTIGKGGKAGSGGDAGGGGDAGEMTGDAGTGGAAPDNPCDPNPCEHGQCTPDGEVYTCACSPGYDGTNCDNNVNDCAPDPCENGGTCSDLVDDYKCDCTGTGYTGKDCTTPPDATCADNPCRFGSCSDVGGRFFCDCTGTGYEGETCETDIDECSRNLDNCDPVAYCEDQDGSFKCACPLYYQDVNRDGTNCKAYDSCAAILAAYPSAPTGSYPIAYPVATNLTHGYCDMTTNGGGWTNLDFRNSVIYLENDNFIHCAQGIYYDPRYIQCLEPYANDVAFLYMNDCYGNDGSANYVFDEIAPLIGHQSYGLGGFSYQQQEWVSGYPDSSPAYYEACYVDGYWYSYYDEPCWAYGGRYPNGSCVPTYFNLVF